MADPIKIIHRYKNNNDKIQYHVNIFIGTLVHPNCMQILIKIQNLDFYQSLIQITQTERTILETNYGIQWYNKFFNNYHIHYTIQTILKNDLYLTTLKSIYGQSWINTHLIHRAKNAAVVTFSYEYAYQNRALRKQKIKETIVDDYQMLEYHSPKRLGPQTATWCEHSSTSMDQEGGEGIDDYNDDLLEDALPLEEEDEDIDSLFNKVQEIDKNVALTTQQIKEVIDVKEYEKNNTLLAFDRSLDNDNRSTALQFVYHKYYITNQYIFKDDSIHNIQNKICCGFKNNDKFGTDTYLMPAYQYLWSEYAYSNEIRKIMIGQKWIIKTSILKLDVVPHPTLTEYLELNPTLRNLRDAIKRHGKIKNENDEYNILTDYDGYYTNNELYLIDVFNELGSGFEPTFEQLKNLIDVYFKIYFPRLGLEEITKIIAALKPATSINNLQSTNDTLFDTLHNDLILENEIIKEVEMVKNENSPLYHSLFGANYVTQSVIRVYLPDVTKIDLYRIFDNFSLNADYPFIQYSPVNGVPRYRFNKEYLIENERKEIVVKWFETAPYGISFKVKVNLHSDYKYMAINLTETGKIDYKIQWKQENMSTVKDIKNTYAYIKNLIIKINDENSVTHLQLPIPENNQFEFAFINSIQKFNLPDNYTIDHNDLSDFAVNFFPYVSLVVEPRKRQSKLVKTQKWSKFGTYLRYKRISNYDNQSRIEKRIIFFIRNYEYTDNALAIEIGKEFNITVTAAFEALTTVRTRYPHLKKSRKILKKLEDLPKYKPPGVGIDIQGKNKENYKIRIAGARNKHQLSAIASFMKVLIYLYVQTYLYKNPQYQKLKERLKGLTKIARRRSKVDQIVYDDVAIKSVKQIISVDKKRLGYKADIDQNQWTRNCQNSGTDKLRRPDQITNTDQLLAAGYTWTDQLDNMPYGHYQKTIYLDKNNEPATKGKPVTLRALALPLNDEASSTVYYTCDPIHNGKHMYVGFLNKSKNPYGESMPCCFIKDQLYSKNSEKRLSYLKNIGLIKENAFESKLTNDSLYILQDSNKIQEGRFAFLPKHLEIVFNLLQKNKYTINNHYLTNTRTGYYFKYGTNQDTDQYLNAVCAAFEIHLETLKNNIVQLLQSEKGLAVFTSLANGDIRAQFKTIETYLHFIQTNHYLTPRYLSDIICIPGVVCSTGVNIIMFTRKTRWVKKVLEKDRLKEDIYVVCQNAENVNNLKMDHWQTAIIIKERKNYYPIVMVKKTDTKTIQITKTFTYTAHPDSIMYLLIKYYQLNCQSQLNTLVKNNLYHHYNAKDTFRLLAALNVEKYLPQFQIIDRRYKCRFLVINEHLFPTLPSGAIYHLPIVPSVQPYLQTYETTTHYLTALANHSEFKCKPIGFYYSQKTNKNYQCVAVMTENYQSVPVVETTIAADSSNHLSIKQLPNDETIDAYLQDSTFVADDRVYEVSKNKYESEMYQLFRFHLSYFLANTEAGKQYKASIVQWLNELSVDKMKAQNEIKKLLYQMTSKPLAHTFVQMIDKLRGGSNPLSTATLPVTESHHSPNSIEIIPTDFYRIGTKQVGNLSNADSNVNIQLPPSHHDSAHPPPIDDAQLLDAKNDQWIYVFPQSKVIDYPNFVLRNHRVPCYHYTNNTVCQSHNYCHWNDNHQQCLFAIKTDLLVQFIGRVAAELIQNDYKAYEILRIGNYFVSDIVDYDVFTERPGEKIVMAANNNLPKILEEIFGKGLIPQLGKSRNNLRFSKKVANLTYDYPLKTIRPWHVQIIITMNDTVFRAFANGYYWLMHPYNKEKQRNLGYYSLIQTKLAAIYKSEIVDYLTHIQEPFIEQVLKTNAVSYAIGLNETTAFKKYPTIELYLLAKLYETVIYIFNENYQLYEMYHPVKGKIETPTFTNYKKSIALKFNFSKNNYPDSIEALYPVSDTEV